jgi:AmmeMemoRadiSam system protein A
VEEEHKAAPTTSETSPSLSTEDKRELLTLARRTREDYLARDAAPKYRGESRALLERRATFVTLRRTDTGKLRGCRGEYVARRSLAESVITMTIAAATDDPRFPPVTADEVPDIGIEISALTPLRPIRPDEVVVGRHGLLIVKGGNAGLLLPQVPVSYGWDRDRFLEALCRKAWLPADAWTSDDAELYGFETETWGEDEGDA